jgi:uncharacterized protein YjiS (DUF1127 family)
MPRIASTPLRLWHDYRRAAAERATVRQLSQLSDGLLRDMGLERGNLREAVRGDRRRR